VPDARFPRLGRYWAAALLVAANSPEGQSPGTAIRFVESIPVASPRVKSVPTMGVEELGRRPHAGMWESEEVGLGLARDPVANRGQATRSPVGLTSSLSYCIVPQRPICTVSVFAQFHPAVIGTGVAGPVGNWPMK
jgi:hypothetical protein